MMETADKIDQGNGQYDADGQSPLYGHGRINALKAVISASGGGDTPDGGLPEVLFMEHRINKSIPDLGEAEDSITFPSGVVIKEIEVNVDIKHTWSGDLQLILIPPQGGDIMLQDRVGGSQHDITKSFRSSNEPGLFTSIIGTPAQGNWSLRVVDTARDDAGVISKWGLAVIY